MLTVLTLNFCFVVLCDQTAPFLQASADDYDTKREPHYHYLKRFAQIIDSSSKWFVNCWTLDDSIALQ